MHDQSRELYSFTLFSISWPRQRNLYPTNSTRLGYRGSLTLQLATRTAMDSFSDDEREQGHSLENGMACGSPRLCRARAR